MGATDYNFVERISRLRRRRRVHGLCAEAGCKHESGESYRCEKHAAMNAARVAKYRATQRLKQGATPWR
jgi:hypothetical protein